MSRTPGVLTVLGDNSPVTADSRTWRATPGHQPGALHEANIIGVATLDLLAAEALAAAERNEDD